MKKRNNERTPEPQEQGSSFSFSTWAAIALLIGVLAAVWWRSPTRVKSTATDEALQKVGQQVEQLDVSAEKLHAEAKKKEVTAREKIRATVHRLPDDALVDALAMLISTSDKKDR